MVTPDVKKVTWQEPTLKTFIVENWKTLLRVAVLAAAVAFTIYCMKPPSMRERCGRWALHRYAESRGGDMEEIYTRAFKQCMVIMEKMEIEP